MTIKRFFRTLSIGLPDGLFSNLKSQILEGLAMENLGIFYDHLIYFTAIGNILRPFGIFCGIFSPVFGILDHGKSGNPDYHDFRSHLSSEAFPMLDHGRPNYNSRHLCVPHTYLPF
jgi:hypothetical protein